MNAAEMKRAAGRALELGLTAVLTVPVVLVILAAAAAAVWLWASRMLPLAPQDVDVFVQDGMALSFGGLSLRVLATPGHTQGSVCYLCGGTLFSGDTLFADGYGRTDLPGGSMAELAQSLKALSRLPREDAIYPGHGESAPLESAMAVLGL